MAFDVERFKAWRATVPWTDTEIADAIDREADGVEQGPRPSQDYVAKLRRIATLVRDKGVLSSRILRYARGRLVKLCGVCGKKALYMQGNGGRCQTHRMVPDEKRQARVMRLDQASERIDAESRVRGAREKRLANLHAARKRNHQKDRRN